jgi:hypothetical protein
VVVLEAAEVIPLAVSRQFVTVDMKKNIIKNIIVIEEIMMMTMMITIIEGEEREEDS